ncbi:hypothetical protein BU23DRAFT_599745 [Bimuria novae-zelandiae CBS 107.79]|uniref:Uncharacterized protein n=1 Tax=Bimuria novae-zelandiae CBS 107.79 TaxID=1447943 RepID=A0A6A5V6G7_9PLEO|nr:hypothetical protein BU23DRAFT_599745 [Bimuria novae-zelandiae CBS 107.79]
MDPITVVGLASNIVQLVSVARHIMLTAKDLRGSKTGSRKKLNNFANGLSSYAATSMRYYCSSLGRLIERLLASPGDNVLQT